MQLRHIRTHRTRGPGTKPPGMSCYVSKIQPPNARDQSDLAASLFVVFNCVKSCKLAGWLAGSLLRRYMKSAFWTSCATFARLALESNLKMPRLKAGLRLSARPDLPATGKLPPRHEAWLRMVECSFNYVTLRPSEYQQYPKHFTNAARWGSCPWFTRVWTPWCPGEHPGC